MNTAYMKCPKCGGEVSPWWSTSFPDDGPSVSSSAASCQPVWILSTDPAYVSEHQKASCGWKGEIKETYGDHARKSFAELQNNAEWAASQIDFEGEPGVAHLDWLSKVIVGLQEIQGWLHARRDFPEARP
jgi:hypothetical protein